MRYFAGFGFVLSIILFICYRFYMADPAVPSVFETPYRTQVRTEFEARMQEQGIEASEHQFWVTPVDGETPQSVLDNKASKLYKEYQLLAENAQRLGVALTPLDLNTAKWQEVSLRYTELKQIAIDHYLQTVSDEQVKVYYEQNQEKYQRQATIKGVLSLWRDGVVASQEKLVIDEENVRLMTEQYGELESGLVGIAVGQQIVWQQENDYYTFVCEAIEEKGVENFETITEAVAIQYAEEQIEAQLSMGKLKS
ncbi:hypothetical protein CAC02_08030 [Streptococcus gallolyticus]|uniref:Uncharacterized protein n=1 Tax=Streptococcus gallolyticus TaxID=315405 RepID=A0A368UC28_9STRE|nr:hypothetical protein [Streptococcus gallolyticus]RCW16515.1 hypothetical protein CAC02_08030 [Streptococcus gallolyticus]